MLVLYKFYYELNIQGKLNFESVFKKMVTNKSLSFTTPNQKILNYVIKSGQVKAILPLA